MPNSEQRGRTVRLHVRLVPYDRALSPVVRGIVLSGISLEQLAKATIRVGDMNGDGRDDVLAGFPDGTVVIALNDHTGSLRFQPLITLSGSDQFVNSVMVRPPAPDRSRLLVPQAAATAPLKELSWTPDGAGARYEPTPIRRAFQSSLLDPFNDTVPLTNAPSARLRERDPVSGQIRTWTFVQEEGLWTLPNESRPPFRPSAVTIGFGFYAGSMQVVEFLRTENDYVVSEPVILHLPNSAGAQELFGDFDGDGDSDLLLVASSPRISRIAVFSPPVLVDIVGLSEIAQDRRTIGVGDFDGDGKDDILLAGPDGLFVLTLEPGEIPCRNTRVQINDSPPMVLNGDNLPLEFHFGQPVDVKVSADGCHFDRAELTLRAGFWGRMRYGFHVVGKHATHRGAYYEIAPEDSQTTLCLGAHPEYLPSKENPVGVAWGRESDECPPGYAIFELDDSVGRHMPALFTCCKLPPDMLVSPGRWYASTQCPPTEIATGLATNRKSAAPHCQDCDAAIRCAPLRNDRYKINAIVRGDYYGVGSQNEFGQRGLGRLDIPSSMRFGIGRMSRTAWDTDGCVGRPWGAVYIGGVGPRCDDVRFATVAPIEGEVPPDFPIAHCRAALDPFNLFEGCP